MGEYINPESLESIFVQHDLIKQIFVYGDSLQDYLVGIIVPEKPEVLRWAKSENIDDTDYESIPKTPKPQNPA